MSLHIRNLSNAGRMPRSLEFERTEVMSDEIALGRVRHANVYDLPTLHHWPMAVLTLAASVAGYSVPVGSPWRYLSITMVRRIS